MYRLGLEEQCEGNRDVDLRHLLMLWGFFLSCKLLFPCPWLPSTGELSFFLVRRVSVNPAKAAGSLVFKKTKQNKNPPCSIQLCLLQDSCVK